MSVYSALQELSPTSDANLTHSLMNIHESLLDEFKDENKLTQLALSDEQKEAWIMVSCCVTYNRIEMEYTCPFTLCSGNVSVWYGVVYWSKCWRDG